MKSIPVRQLHSAEHEPAGRFTIRQVQHMLAGKDMVQPLHRHDFYFILILEKASGHHAIDFIPHKVTSGSVFLLRPGQVHSLTLKAGSTGYLIEFTPDFFHPNHKQYTPVSRNHTGSFKPDTRTFRKLQALGANIWQEYADKQDGYLNVIQATLNILFIALGRLTRKESGNQLYDYTQERFDELLQLLEKQITRHKRVSYYADAMSLSPYQLNAITKNTLGKTCSGIIDDHIILESKRYLLTTTGTVNQIAQQLGYDDVSYFIRFFRKHTGFPPEAFRDKFR